MLNQKLLPVPVRMYTNDCWCRDLRILLTTHHQRVEGLSDLLRIAMVLDGTPKPNDRLLEADLMTIITFLTGDKNLHAQANFRDILMRLYYAAHKIEEIPDAIKRDLRKREIQGMQHDPMEFLMLLGDALITYIQVRSSAEYEGLKSVVLEQEYLTHSGEVASSNVAETFFRGLPVRLFLVCDANPLKSVSEYADPISMILRKNEEAIVFKKEGEDGKIEAQIPISHSRQKLRTLEGKDAPVLLQIQEMPVQAMDGRFYVRRPYRMKLDPYTQHSNIYVEGREYALTQCGAYKVLEVGAHYEFYTAFEKEDGTHEWIYYDGYSAKPARRLSAEEMMRIINTTGQLWTYTYSTQTPKASAFPELETLPTQERLSVPISQAVLSIAVDPTHRESKRTKVEDPEKEDLKSQRKELIYSLFKHYKDHKDVPTIVEICNKLEISRIQEISMEDIDKARVILEIAKAIKNHELYRLFNALEYYFEVYTTEECFSAPGYIKGTSERDSRNDIFRTMVTKFYDYVVKFQSKELYGDLFSTPPLLQPMEGESTIADLSKLIYNPHDVKWVLFPELKKTEEINGVVDTTEREEEVWQEWLKITKCQISTQKAFQAFLEPIDLEPIEKIRLLAVFEDSKMALAESRTLEVRQVKEIISALLSTDTTMTAAILVQWHTAKYPYLKKSQYLEFKADWDRFVTEAVQLIEQQDLSPLSKRLIRYNLEKVLKSLKNGTFLAEKQIKDPRSVTATPSSVVVKDALTKEAWQKVVDEVETATDSTEKIVYKALQDSPISPYQLLNEWLSYVKSDSEIEGHDEILLEELQKIEGLSKEELQIIFIAIKVAQAFYDSKDMPIAEHIINAVALYKFYKERNPQFEVEIEGEECCEAGIAALDFLKAGCGDPLVQNRLKEEVLEIKATLTLVKELKEKRPIVTRGKQIIDTLKLGIQTETPLETLKLNEETKLLIRVVRAVKIKDASAALESLMRLTWMQIPIEFLGDRGLGINKQIPEEVVNTLYLECGRYWQWPEEIESKDTLTLYSNVARLIGLEMPVFKAALLKLLNDGWVSGDFEAVLYKIQRERTGDLVRPIPETKQLTDERTITRRILLCIFHEYKKKFPRELAKAIHQVQHWGKFQIPEDFKAYLMASKRDLLGVWQEVKNANEFGMTPSQLYALAGNGTCPEALAKQLDELFPQLETEFQETDALVDHILKNPLSYMSTPWYTQFSHLSDTVIFRARVQIDALCAEINPTKYPVIGMVQRLQTQILASYREQDTLISVLFAAQNELETLNPKREMPPEIITEADKAAYLQKWRGLFLNNTLLRLVYNYTELAVEQAILKLESISVGEFKERQDKARITPKPTHFWDQKKDDGNWEEPVEMVVDPDAIGMYLGDVAEQDLVAVLGQTFFR